jgi:hypothetical protein
VTVSVQFAETVSLFQFKSKLNQSSGRREFHSLFGSLFAEKAAYAPQWSRQTAEAGLTPRLVIGCSHRRHKVFSLANRVHPAPFGMQTQYISRLKCCQCQAEQEQSCASVRDDVKTVKPDL